MAAPAPSDKVKDKEYINWLKVTLGLYYMKSGLHTFAQSEVDCLHQSLVQKIYGSKTALLPPCTMCHSSRVIRNKYSGAWTFQKRCRSCCNVWLHELLILHTNPKSEKIYWDNSHVPSWPFKPWECAKVFMPKGQLPSNAGPAECDAQALLTLLASCRHFHKKLSPQGLGLTHSISVIRNKIIHDGEMKVSDADRTSFIQQFIQLLQDPVYLKSLRDCKTAVSNIHKINNNSVDVFFNLGLEMTALMAVVKEIRKECQMQEKIVFNNVDSLKQEYRKLTKRFENAENKLELHGESTTKRFKDVEKNLDLHGERLGAVEEYVVKLQEKTGQMTRENNSCMNESCTKRRPESDGLRQLKSQTEDKLDTVRKLECISTTWVKEAKKMLERKRSLVIKGNPGEGKTTTALNLIDNKMYRDRRVVVYSPTDWKTVDTDWVDIVVLEDILGKYDFDPGHLQEWMVYLPTIQEHVDAGKLQVIITTRVDILAKAFSRLGSLKLFSDHLSLTLSSEHLNNSEKMRILNRELRRHKKVMKEDEKEKCITNFSGLIGFPQCCLLFAADSNLFGRGPEFFNSPEELFLVNIHGLKAEIFLSLAFLFCHGKIYEEYLSPETMPKSCSDLFMELASHLHISKKKADITLLRDSYECFSGLYIVKSISYEVITGVSVKKTCIWFSHATVCEAVGQVLAKHSLEMVVKHGDPEYIYQKTYTAEAKDRTSKNVFIPISLYPLMAERMVHDVVEKEIVKSVVKHSVLKQNLFLMKLKNELLKGNRIKDFFMANTYSKLEFFCQDLSEGECITFLQYVLQSDKVTVKLVYSQFMEFLECTHRNNTSNCWKCKEKQSLLELALYYHHHKIADKLIAMNACYTHTSLCNAAKHGDHRRVQTILEYLVRFQVFDPECMEAKEALCIAIISENQDVIEILLEEGITLDSMQVIYVVQHGDINALMKVVEHLKCHNKWDPHCEQWCTNWYFYPPDLYLSTVRHDCNLVPCTTALYIAYCIEKFDMADYLFKNEVRVFPYMLPFVSENSSDQAVARVITDWKATGTWDPHTCDASEALETAYIKNKYDICDLLRQEGVSLTMMNLSGVVGVYQVSLEFVKKEIQHLKGTKSWNPKCYDASRTLENAYRAQKYDVCDMLIQEGVSLTMKNLPGVIEKDQASLESVKKAVQHLKDTENWDPKCDDASDALRKAYNEDQYDVCQLLIQEGISLTMKNLPSVTSTFPVLVSLESVKKAIQHLKNTEHWDPMCNDASKALARAFCERMYTVCDLLVHEGVSLTMKNLSGDIMRFRVSLESVKKVIQHLKDTNNWDPMCSDASKALEKAYDAIAYDVCDLLIQEGVSL